MQLLFGRHEGHTTKGFSKGGRGEGAGGRRSVGLKHQRQVGNVASFSRLHAVMLRTVHGPSGVKRFPYAAVVPC